MIGAAARRQLSPVTPPATDAGLQARSGHAMASDPHALRMLLRASEHALDTPVSCIVADGWSNLAPAVQYNLAVEVLAPAWLARTAPDFSDPAIWSGGRPG